MQKKILAGLMIIVMFGFSGQYFVNLASADDSQSTIQNNAAISQARALLKYEHTHALPLDQSTKYAGSVSTPTDENVVMDRNVNIANGQIYSQAKAMTIFNEIHILGIDKFSTSYAGLASTSTDETVHMDRNIAIALAKANMDKNNIKIIEALASIQPKYVGIDNTQTTDSNGRDRNVLIQQGIAVLEQQNADLAAQLASLTTNYAKLADSVTTDSNGRDRQAYIEKTLADSEARAIALLGEMNVSMGAKYVGIDNTQTTDSNGRDRNVLIAEGRDAVNQKIVGCYDAEHPRTCNIGSGAAYAQYAP
ncbi:MAG: hypothetical protein HY222_04005 [Thaumarchaeota archaeon]|nr:hypothetical protein [Nitrososphaerota archaeon]MBI3641539.1 hypothetical protein [Nitrososphaerota archaeon]